MINSNNINSSYNNINMVENRAYVKSDYCKSQYANATVYINKISDLSVTKTANCVKFEVNKIITYIINVKNNGPSKASGIVLFDVLPPSVIFNKIVLSQGHYTLKKGCVICYLGSIHNGDKITVTLNVIPKVHFPIINSVFVIGNEFDPNKENNVDFLELYCKKNSPCDIYELILMVIVFYILYKLSRCN